MKRVILGNLVLIFGEVTELLNLVSFRRKFISLDNLNKLLQIEDKLNKNQKLNDLILTRNWKTLDFSVENHSF